MTGNDDHVHRSRNRPRSEQLIGVLIPADIRRPPPMAAPVPRLPVPVPNQARALLVDAARVDASGRICATSVLRELGWTTGRRIGITLADRYLLAKATPEGTVTVGVRGSIGLPSTVARCAASKSAPS